jgi:hypothetical protein
VPSSQQARKQQAKCQEDMPSVKKSEPERKMEREERVDTTATKAATKATFDQNLVKATKQQQPLLYDFMTINHHLLACDCKMNHFSRPIY